MLDLNYVLSTSFRSLIPLILFWGSSMLHGYKPLPQSKDTFLIRQLLYNKTKRTQPSWTTFFEWEIVFIWYKGNSDFQMLFIVWVSCVFLWLGWTCVDSSICWTCIHCSGPNRHPRRNGCSMAPCCWFVSKWPWNKNSKIRKIISNINLKEHEVFSISQKKIIRTSKYMAIWKMD